MVVGALFKKSSVDIDGKEIPLLSKCTEQIVIHSASFTLSLKGYEKPEMSKILFCPYSGFFISGRGAECQRHFYQVGA